MIPSRFNAFHAFTAVQEEIPYNSMHHPCFGHRRWVILPDILYQTAEGLTFGGLEAADWRPGARAPQAKRADARARRLWAALMLTTGQHQGGLVLCPFPSAPGPARAFRLL